MNTSPIVSILLPVYNGERTVARTIDSLLNQTFADYEILVGIDKPSDKSRQIIEGFMDERISIFENKENLGLANNLNKLISLSSSGSKYIAMAEQDDWYNPQRLEWQVEVMESDKEIGLVSGIAKFISDNKEVLFPGILVNGNQFPQGKALFKYLYINQLKVVNTCMLLRKSVHLDNGIKFQDNYGNFNVDWDYVLRFSLISKVYGINKVLVEMDRTTKNKSVTKNKKAQFRASRKLLLDYREKYTDLVNPNLYHKAIKKHRKIEMGFYPKGKLVLYALIYFFRYFDSYFLKYIFIRLQKFNKGKNL